MSRRLIKMLSIVCAVSAIFSSCSKKYSSDTVLPTTYSPSVLVGNDNNILYALDPQTGAKNWEYSFPQSIYASPLVYGGMVYVGITNLNSGLGQLDTLYKLNGQTGALVKKMVFGPVHNFSIKSTPIADGKLIYIATTNDSIYAIDTGTAAVQWRFGETSAGGSFISSPTIFNGQLYIASTSGNVYAIDKAAGTQTWSYSPGAGKSFVSSPAIGDSFLFVGCSDSSVYCLYLNTSGGNTAGTLKWSFGTRGAVTSSPAAYFGNCVFGSNDFNVYCVDVISGAQKWKFATSSNINFTSPTITSQVAYIGSNDYNMYALNMIDGSMKWKFTTNGLIASSPLAYHGTIYIGSFDNNFYAVDSALGTLKWSKYVGGQIECSPAINDFSGVQANSQISGFTN